MKKTNVKDYLNLFISTFNQGLKNNKKFIILPFHNKIINLISFLYNEGYILSYKIISTFDFTKKHSIFFIILSYKYYKGKKIINELVHYTKPSKPINYSYLHLNKYKQTYLNKRILISTTKGLQWLSNCIFLKLGGVLLFEIV